VAGTEPLDAETLVTVVYNPIGANEAQLESVLPGVIRPRIPRLRSAVPWLRWQNANSSEW
jgi:hypothetical protein